MGTCSVAGQLVSECPFRSERVTVGECMCTYKVALLGSVDASCCLPVVLWDFVYGLNAVEELCRDQLVRNLANILQHFSHWQLTFRSVTILHVLYALTSHAHL